MCMGMELIGGGCTCVLHVGGRGVSGVPGMKARAAQSELDNWIGVLGGDDSGT